MSATESHGKSDVPSEQLGRRTVAAGNLCWARGRFNPAKEEKECIAADLTPWASKIIVGASPNGTTDG